MQANLSEIEIARVATFPDMESVAERIKFVRKLSGLTQAGFAARLGTTRGAVGNWELGGGIDTPNLTAIADKFGVPLDWLANNRGSAPESVSMVPATAGMAPARSAGLQEAPQPFSGHIMPRADEIPLYGQILGGQIDAVQFDDEEASTIPRPPILWGVHGAYAAYVVGDSMEPRYSAGEIVHVNPRHPPLRNRDVAVQVQTEDGGPIILLVKRLISPWPSNILRLQQFNPRTTRQFPASKVLAVHRIVGREDR